MNDGTQKTHSKFANSQRDTIKLPKKILAKIFLPQKIPKSKILNPPKSFDHPGHSKSGVLPTPPPPAPELKLQKVLKSISYCELKG